MAQFDEDKITEELRHPDTCRDAFSEVVKHFSRSLYWQIRRMVLSHDDADDILQNTFLKAWSNIELFRGEAKLSTWLYRIAVNESINFLNKQKKMQNIPVEEEYEFMINRLESDEYFDGDEIQKTLQEAILTLPEKQRMVFNMKYFDEMKYEDISDILGTSVGALKATYHHAVKKIETFVKSKSVD
ncbi:MAG: sigma-70 family RNA polymerase sigma factor [Bacteroidales bacterium]|nr:sigma-70 family RNA polymerase sigma factor [Bacteroidales bacterium]MBQ7818267.1 sigma-70 family RNA polymerase sigma factor [Bacteroidales bacterium]